MADVDPLEDAAYAKAVRRIERCRIHRDHSLNLSSLDLATLPPEIRQLTTLEVLSLSRNRLAELPPQIGQLTALKELYLRNNQLGELPPQIGQLTALETLGLSGNQLGELPPQIGQLTALERLDLSRNQLAELPPQIGQLKALERLDLSRNQLTELPPQIGQLTALKELYLYTNRLRELPLQIGQLTALERLDLSRNQLTELPPQIGQLTALKELYLSHIQLAALPPVIGQLTALVRFDLSDNRLAELPPQIGQLTALERLDLSRNQLTELPPQIGQLTALERLDLSRNRLATLPEVIGTLKALRMLNLSDNQLETLENVFGQLTALEELYLHANPNLEMPDEALGPTSLEVGSGLAKHKLPKEILDWYFRNLAAKVKRPILEAKVILVGWGAVGKTSLRRRLIDGSFDEDEDTTHKIEITPWRVRIGTQDVKLHVWDFGGQEIMHATHQFFLTKRSLYVLVLAGREKTQGAQDAEYWLRLIKGFGGDSPTLVVLNKQHQCQFDLNRQSLHEKYPFIKSFLETDCEPPLHLTELKDLILREVNQLPELRREFDANWMAIKDEVTDLKQKGRKRMPVSDYFQLCQQQQEHDPQGQKLLLGFLHDLGVVVCFHEDHRLANDGVLDPQWVVDGIYKILNEPTLKGGDGRVTRHQIRELLPGADYSDDDVRVLVDLMEKFQLCFWLNDRRAEFVVPELMTEQEANWKQHFPDMEKCLRFELKYDFLPEGLLPRFIVATHDLSQGGERWRSGVILRSGKTAALVRGDAAGSPPLIRIAVSGPVATRRELLAVIRRELAKINHTIAGLEVKERVPVPGYDVEPLIYNDLVAAEAAGEKAWPIVVAGQLVKIPFTTLLDGIEPKQQRKARADRKQSAGITVTAGDNSPVSISTGVTSMAQDHSIHIGNVSGSQMQVGQTLSNCSILIQQAPAERKDLLDTLQREVKRLIDGLPDDKKDEAPQVAENLEMLVKQASSPKPNRKWYDVSAEGLLEAAKWVKDFGGVIGSTVLSLGKAIWPDFQLPQG